MAPPDGPTWMYLAFCEHRAPLYIGIAHDVERRVEQHRTTKPKWREQVWAMIAYELPTRRQALDLETHMIRSVRPAWNVAGQPPGPMRPDVRPHDPLRVLSLDPRGRLLGDITSGRVL